MTLPLPPELIDLLPVAVVVVEQGVVIYSNKTADELGVRKLDNVLLEKIQQGKKISIHEHIINSAGKKMQVTVHVQPLENAQTLLTIDPHGQVAQHPNASVWKNEVTRAAGLMAAMLAHEVKNPLSSIRGAAQLLRDDMDVAHQPLTDLICSETLRITELLDQVEVFSDERKLPRGECNIHELLHYCMDVAKTGFAPQVQFVEKYDPSLPDIFTHREQLIQLILNLIKNSCEAMDGQSDAKITLTTAYESGFRLQDKKLPISFTIRDNGPGIPAGIRDKLFEPFVSNKEQGRGLGLAVVAKLAADLDIVVELDATEKAGAGFILHLPCD
jgi:two-component system nitrogen regulation sensor histidine kinase GlnL